MGGLALEQASEGLTPRLPLHSAVSTGALKKTSSLIEIVLLSPGQRAVVVVEHGLPVDAGEIVEHFGSPRAVHALDVVRAAGGGEVCSALPEIRSPRNSLGRLEQRIDDIVPDVDIGEEQIGRMERRRVKETVRLFPADRRVRQIA